MHAPRKMVYGLQRILSGTLEAPNLRITDSLLLAFSEKHLDLTAHSSRLRKKLAVDLLEGLSYTGDN